MAPIGDSVETALSNSLAQLVDKAFQGIIGRSRESANAVAAKLVIGFERYISTTLSRCTNVKTLISQNAPISLDVAYEPVDLQIGGVTIPIDTFISELGQIRNRALITATLGSGKSFSMRYIYSRLCIDRSMRRIPIFLDLRKIPFNEKSIVSYVNDTLQPFTKFVSESSIYSGLKSGVFALLLDGFDEIPSKHQREAERQITKLAAEYPGNILIISSRPDRARFVSWHDFPEYQVAGLTIDKLEGMINRIQYDEDDKATFVARVKKGLYRSHKAILSNPLLASMMLLTFKEFQDVPSKMHAFYSTAFDVLYRRHDSTKPDYQREFRSGLDLTDFRRVFMTFCFMSFLDRVTAFKKNTFMSYAKKALEYEELDVRPDDILFDLVNTICIIHVEGEDISFIHRSFQEYFSALFIARRSIDKIDKYIDFLFLDGSADDFFLMLFEIDKEEFERKYLVRKFVEIYESLSSTKSEYERVRRYVSTIIVMRSDDVDFATIMPIGFRTGPKDDACNFHSVGQTIGSSYGLPMYYISKLPELDWEMVLQGLGIPSGDMGIVKSAKAPDELLAASGLTSYVNTLTEQLEQLNLRLASRHSRKVKLLSDSLRRPRGQRSR